MSTRSTIGRLNVDGSVSAIYCHSDGYLDGVGGTLVEFYQDPAKVDALIALGDLSAIQPEIGEKHDFDWSREYYRSGDYRAMDADPRKKMCNAYGRDRGEEGTEAKVYDTEAAYWAGRRDYGAEYQYLFKDGTWHAKAYDTEPLPFSDALAADRAA